MQCEDNIAFVKVSLKEMLETLAADIVAQRPINEFYWKNGYNTFHKISECDLFRGRFITEDGDFSEFDWELKESSIYMKR